MNPRIMYELINITFEINYELDEFEKPSFACEELHTNETPKNKDWDIEYDINGIPKGRTRPEIKIREKIIKDFYAKWISEHPDKSITNKNLNSKICIKYLSINETYAKASRSYTSTLAVFRLTEILENAILIEEVTPKNNKNQKQFEKILYMKYENIKLTVGLQRTRQEHVQYCITVPQ